MTNEFTYSELHSHLHTSPAQKAVEAKWQEGFNAYLSGEAYDPIAAPAWKEGFKESWYEMNKISVNLDPNGEHTEFAWQGYIDLNSISCGTCGKGVQA